MVSSNWGGSTDAVLKLSKNQIAASQLALFINTNKESALKLANEQFLFPAMKEILTDPSFVNQESKFYGGQKVNEKFAQISETVSTGLSMAAVHGLRVHELQRNAREGIRRQDRRSCRPAGMAGRLCQVRQRPGLHGRLTHRLAPGIPMTGAKQLSLERGLHVHPRQCRARSRHQQHRDVRV